MPRLTFTMRVSRLVNLHPKSCPSGPVQRGRDAGAIPTGARLGKGARDGTALVCGFQGTLSFGQGFTRAERICVRGQGADSPLAGQRPAVKAGILRDGFGVPLARNIACDV
jgi:hypothetical protein